MKKRLFDFFMSFVYFYRVVLNLSLTKRIQYKGAFQEKKIYVMGTGPSLGKSLCEILQMKDLNADFFALNDFSSSDFYTTVTPSYYIIVDPCYWTPRDQTNDVDYEARLNTFREIENNTTWPMILFVPANACKVFNFKDIFSNPNITIRPFNYTNYYPTDTDYYFSFILKNNFGVVPVGNVLGQAIYLALNMKYCDIKILGAEHSWTKDLCVNNQNQVCTIKRHFYEGGVEGQIIPWLKSNTEPFKMYEVLNSISNHFKGYLFLEKYAKRLNAKIVNCTPDSFIDAFQREI